MRSITTDVVVVGSGAAGLLAAATVRRAGLECILVESTDKIGGSSAMSGGALWLPNNHLMAALGERDSVEDARTYLDACLGEERPGSTRARREAYLETAATLAHHLESLGLPWRPRGATPTTTPSARAASRRGAASSARSPTWTSSASGESGSG